MYKNNNRKAAQTDKTGVFNAFLSRLWFYAAQAEHTAGTDSMTFRRAPASVFTLFVSAFLIVFCAMPLSSCSRYGAERETDAENTAVAENAESAGDGENLTAEGNTSAESAPQSGAADSGDVPGPDRHGSDPDISGDIISDSHKGSEDGKNAASESRTVQPGDEDGFNDAGQSSAVMPRVKGIYLGSVLAGDDEFMNGIIETCDRTELNAVVIDIKDDYGRITFDMKNVPVVQELGASYPVIPDMEGLLAKLHEHGIYVIARIVTMRDPLTPKTKPQWACRLADGSVFVDNSGYSWMNPYCTEYRDYLLDVGKECLHTGFDEVQFDYIRFCTEKGSSDVVFTDEEVMGRDKISTITQLVQYLSAELHKEGGFVSCDVFGTIIGSTVDSQSVGQSYENLAETVDAICPMIYPSHYSKGNFGLETPDTKPYESIKGALELSSKALDSYYDYEDYDYGDRSTERQKKTVVVRPWLQAFTASWLGSGRYIKYDSDVIRREIDAVYDSGYDEWILWSASVKYDLTMFLDKEAEEAENERIEKTKAERAALAAEEAKRLPPELEEALDGDELRPEYESILSEEGPIVTEEKTG